MNLEKTTFFRQAFLCEWRCLMPFGKHFWRRRRSWHLGGGLIPERVRMAGTRAVFQMICEWWLRVRVTLNSTFCSAVMFPVEHTVGTGSIP